MRRIGFRGYMVIVIVIVALAIGGLYFFNINRVAPTATNKANARKNTLTGMIMNSIAGSNEMAYQQEMFWHRQIYEIFESFIQ